MTGPLTLIGCRRRWRPRLLPTLMVVIGLELAWIGLMLW
jgi:hypothetical protein